MNNARFLLPFEQGLLDMPDANVAVFRPVYAFGLSSLPAGTMLEQGFKPLHSMFLQAGFTVEPLLNNRFDLSLVHLTRNKIESLAIIARAARMTKGVVMVNGAKTDGIESILKQVKKHVTPEGVISKSHGKVFWFRDIEFPDWEAAGNPAENSSGLITAPGMFSAGKIDLGSQRLLPFLAGLTGRGADLGAGWGWLSMQILQQQKVIKLDSFEADYYSLVAAETNVNDPRATFHWADVTTLSKPNEPYDFVVSNPPFHLSRKADPELGKAFIKTASTLIKPNGRFLMVANRQLPYEACLDQYFKSWKSLLSDGQFKVFEATRPRK